MKGLMLVVVFAVLASPAVAGTITYSGVDGVGAYGHGALSVLSGLLCTFTSDDVVRVSSSEGERVSYISLITPGLSGWVLVSDGDSLESRVIYSAFTYTGAKFSGGVITIIGTLTPTNDDPSIFVSDMFAGVTIPDADLYPVAEATLTFHPLTPVSSLEEFFSLDGIQNVDQVTLTITGTAIPEPLSMSLLAMGGLALIRRRGR